MKYKVFQKRYPNGSREVGIRYTSDSFVGCVVRYYWRFGEKDYHQDCPNIDFPQYIPKPKNHKTVVAMLQKFCIEKTLS